MPPPVVLFCNVFVMNLHYAFIDFAIRAFFALASRNSDLSRIAEARNIGVIIAGVIITRTRRKNDKSVSFDSARLDKIIKSILGAYQFLIEIVDMRLKCESRFAEH